MYIDAEECPKVQGPANYLVAAILHIALFAAFYFIGTFHKDDGETHIPLDLTLVVHENLDGVENEPPPKEEPVAPIPEPKEEPPEPPPPPTESDRQVEAVATVEAPKTNKVETVKTPDPPAPRPREKTAEELRQERINRMRSEAKDVKNPFAKNPRPFDNGRTERRVLSEAEINQRLNAGYRPGAYNGDLDASDEARCQALIRAAIEERWNRMQPQIGREGTVLIEIRLGAGGKVASVRLSGSCGDGVSDAAAMSVVSAVRAIRGLSADFIRRYSSKPLTISYRVKSSR